MIVFVGFAVLLVGTVSGAENTTCSSGCSPDPGNATEPCNITSGECPFGCLPGYAGPNCSVVCPSNCSLPLQNNSETCNATTKECLYGCQLGFAGPTCAFVCPDKCTVRTSLQADACNSSTGECLFGCQYGYTGPNCTIECPSSCGISEELNAQTCNETSEQCLFGCLQGYGGQTCSYNCSKTCAQPLTNNTETCDIIGKCLLGCMPGYAGPNCSFDCPNNCSNPLQNNTETCNSTTGDCLHGCQPGYGGPDCSYICPTNCLLPVADGTETCNYTSGECLHGCQKGFAGPNCSYECPANCTPPTTDGIETCNYTNGECLLGCKDGHAGADCSFACPSSCMFPSENETGTCNDTTGECLHGCKDGFAGPNCSFECPAKCMYPSVNETGTCNHTTGDCLHGCKQGYAGANCSVGCPQNCAPSNNPGDEICNATYGECLFGCKDGFYGSNCTQKCTDKDKFCKRCTAKTDNSGIVCHECGVQNFYIDNGICLACNYWCLNGPAPVCRENDGYCNHGCRPGRYGFKCKLRCSSTCKDKCHRETGNCEGEECKYTSYCGPTCELECQDGCISQKCNKTCHCEEGCNPKYWGGQCKELCSLNCNPPSDSNSRTCDISGGTCLYGCKDNKYWGIDCEEFCSNDCLNGTCQQSGNCTDGCKSESVYGWNCNTPCSEYCLNGTCERADGYCDKGCVKGSYGETCDKTCNTNCIDKTCERVNGSCDNGCSTGFYGEQCEEPCSDKCLNLKCDRVGGNCTDGCISGYQGVQCKSVMPIDIFDALSSNWVYVAIGCGALVALGVMATIVLVTKKRRQIAKRRRTARMSTLPDEKVLEESQIRHRRKAEGAGNRITQLFVENPLARFMRYRSHGGDLITKTPLKEILGRVIKMDENDYGREFDEFKTGLTKPHEASRKIDNLALNFFNGIYPYDENRVILRHSFDEEDVKRKSKVKRGILKSVHFTTFRPNRDSTYEVLEVDKKGHGDTNEKKTEASTKRRNKGKDVSNGYASVVFDIQDETGGEGLIKQDNKADVDDYATVDISGGVKPPSSGKGDSPYDYAKVTNDDKSKPSEDEKLGDGYDHINKDKNGETSKTDLTKDGETCEYSVVRKERDGSYDHLGGNEGGEASKADEPKQEEQCDYAVVHKDKDGGRLADDADASRRKSEDGKVTITKDYINASFIKGHNQNEKYIAAQAPSKLTANDFWMMAWEQKSSFVIMLTEIPEEGFSRCEKYWPDLDNQETYGDITVTCYDCSAYVDYTIRLLKLSLKNGHEREIVHLQFNAWPDEGCPVSAIDFIQFHQKYRSLTKGRHSTGPTIVHCTAGVGRTGVFIALDILVEEGLDTLNVDVFKCVVALREQRVNMVHSIDQYEFLYKAVAQTFALEAQPCHKLRLQDKLTELKKFDHDSGKSKLELLYQNLKASLVLDTAEIATMDVVQERKRKDRPTSDVPDVLFRPDLPQKGYINAVIFESLKKKEAMVATQMPTPDTLQDFCQLLVYHQCSTVIMLNNFDPNDKSIGMYWPTTKTPVVAGKMIVSQISIDKESDYIIRELRIHTPETSEDTPAWEVTMIQYKGWKIVKNVPNAKNLLKILQVCQRYIYDVPDKRLLIHCMNGAEQSGLFCALINLLELVDSEDEVSVTSVVRKILARRPNALPTADQFEMCFAAACEYIKRT